jgi:hypothetical protein
LIQSRNQQYATRQKLKLQKLKLKQKHQKRQQQLQQQLCFRNTISSSKKILDEKNIAPASITGTEKTEESLKMML